MTGPLLTLGEVRASSAINIAGVSSTGQRFAELTNEATRRLMKRGDWPGTILPIFVCVARGCVVWPRYVGQVRKLNLCRMHHVPIKNIWWDFVPDGLTRGPDGRANWLSYCGSGVGAVSYASSPTFSSVLGDGRTIRACSFTPLDDNKTIKLFGEDCNGQPLTTKGIGGWTDGITLTLKAPYVETAITVRRIDRVIKDFTQGPVRLYANNSGTLEDLAYYEPSETNPSYQRSQLHIPGCNNTPTGVSGDCPTTRPVVALVKLRFIPAKADTDLVLIPDIDALKNAMMSVRSEEANDFDLARQQMADAVHELNLTLADDNPEDQITVEMNELGGTGIGRQRCF